MSVLEKLDVESGLGKSEEAAPLPEKGVSLSAMMIEKELKMFFTRDWRVVMNWNDQKKENSEDLIHNQTWMDWKRLLLA